MRDLLTWPALAILALGLGVVAAFVSLSLRWGCAPCLGLTVGFIVTARATSPLAANCGALLIVVSLIGYAVWLVGRMMG